jgi:hypothetical protein
MKIKYRTQPFVAHINMGRCKKFDENIPDAHLFAVQMVDDYFAYIIYFLSTGVSPPDFTTT